MTYQTQLFPWCIIRPLPNMRQTIVARFRRRCDAEAHLTLACGKSPCVANAKLGDESAVKM